MKPILRYPGSKWTIAPWILKHAPYHTHYVEPFGGGGGVLLRKPRCDHEIYNDLNHEVVTLFKVLRDQPEEFQRILELTPYSKEEYDQAFILDTDNELEIARRLVYRTYASWGTKGLRSDLSNMWSISKIRADAKFWVNIPRGIQELADRLKGVYIECQDAIKVIQYWDSDTTWHYVDPPYTLDTRMEKKIYPNEMTDQDHKFLSKCLHNVKGKVCLSGYNSDLYQSLYGEWHREDISTYIFGQKKDGTQSKRIESIWMNYSIDDETLPFFT